MNNTVVVDQWGNVYTSMEQAKQQTGKADYNWPDYD